MEICIFCGIPLGKCKCDFASSMKREIDKSEVQIERMYKELLAIKRKGNTKKEKKLLYKILDFLGIPTEEQDACLERGIKVFGKATKSFADSFIDGMFKLNEKEEKNINLDKCPMCGMHCVDLENHICTQIEKKIETDEETKEEE